MAKVFPGGKDRIPDLVNLKIIRKEVRDLEDLVINARQNGRREVVTDQTTFTDPNVASAQSPINEVIGNADFADQNTTKTTDSGNTIQINDKIITLAARADSSNTVSTKDTTYLTATGDLVFGGSSTYTVSFSSSKTLNELINDINGITGNTGVTAEAIKNDSGNYFLRLKKDNQTNGDGIVIDASSTDVVVSDIGLQETTYPVSLTDVVEQINETDNIDLEASVDSSGPYNLKLATNLNSGRIAIQSGAYGDFGLSQNTTYYVDLSDETITLNNHGYSTGDQVQVQSDNQLPTPLNSFPDSLYYVIEVDSNTIKLATTEQKAQDNVAIDLTQYGEGTFSIQKTLESEIYFEIWQNYLEDRVREQHMDEVIDYFEENDYMIFRTINTNTDSTFKWNIRW